MVPVKSSNLHSIGYDGANKRLTVKFITGGVYVYEGVVSKDHFDLMNADSVGKHFNAHIMKKYKGVKQEPETIKGEGK